MEGGREQGRRKIKRETSEREGVEEGLSGRDSKGGVIINLATMGGNIWRGWGDRDA